MPKPVPMSRSAMSLVRVLIAVRTSASLSAKKVTTESASNARRRAPSFGIFANVQANSGWRNTCAG